jgi:hypothetical protein
MVNLFREEIPGAVQTAVVACPEIIDSSMLVEAAAAGTVWYRIILSSRPSSVHNICLFFHSSCPFHEKSPFDFYILVCTSIQVCPLSDLHLVLVANSEFELNLGEPATQASWILNDKRMEKQAIDK